MQSVSFHQHSRPTQERIGIQYTRLSIEKSKDSTVEVNDMPRVSTQLANSVVFQRRLVQETYDDQHKVVRI